MADRKITGHTAITAAQVDTANDVIEIVDVSDTTDAASGTNKKMTADELKVFVLPPQRITGVTTNRRHGNQFINASLTTIGATANQFQSFPLYINRKITIDKLGFEVTTGTTGKMWVALYSVDSTGLPSALVAWSGELTITAPGVYEGLSVASVDIQPGVYFIAFLTNTGNTCRGISAANAHPYLGVPSTIGGGHGECYFKNLTYQATAPDPFPSAGTITSGGLNPLFLFYRAI